MVLEAATVRPTSRSLPVPPRWTASASRFIRATTASCSMSGSSRSPTSSPDLPLLRIYDGAPGSLVAPLHRIADRAPAPAMTRTAVKLFRDTDTTDFGPREAGRGHTVSPQARAAGPARDETRWEALLWAVLAGGPSCARHRKDEDRHD